LEIVNVFIKKIQGKDVFIYDFVTMVKICQVDLFMMYYNPFTSYQHEHFQVLYGIVDNSFITSPTIGLLTSMETLYFHIVGHSYQAHIFYAIIGVIQLMCNEFF
jgi:hypothetical protein